MYYQYCYMYPFGYPKILFVRTIFCIVNIYKKNFRYQQSIITYFHILYLVDAWDIPKKLKKKMKNIGNHPGSMHANICVYMYVHSCMLIVDRYNK